MLFFFFQPRISSAVWWKKIQPSVSPVIRHSDTPGEKHTRTPRQNFTHRLTKRHKINTDIDVLSEVLTENLCARVFQDRRGYSPLQEHPWVSEPTDQKELRQEQMEGKFCLLQFILCGFGSIAAYYSTTTPQTIVCVFRRWITVVKTWPAIRSLNLHHLLSSWEEER